MPMRSGVERGKDMKKKFIQKEYWQKTARDWDRKADPVRPSRETIRICNNFVRQILEKNQNKKVAILGATPEIRDMLYKYYFLNKIQVICLDWLEEMYHAMSLLTSQRIPKERFIKTNWLKMKIPNNSIDIFIGDFILGNIISKNDKEQLLWEINQKLKRNGYLITRHAYITPQVKIKNLKRYVIELGQAVLEEKFNIKQAAMTLFAGLLLASWYRNKENQLSFFYWIKNFDDLKKYFKKEHLSYSEVMGKIVFNYFLSLVGDYYVKKCWVYYPQKEEERILGKYFIIKKKIFPRDCKMAFNMPIYCLKPKK